MPLLGSQHRVPVLVTQPGGSQAPGVKESWGGLPYRLRSPEQWGTSLPGSSSGPWPHSASRSWGQSSWGVRVLPCLPELRARAPSRSAWSTGPPDPCKHLGTSAPACPSVPTTRALSPTRMSLGPSTSPGDTPDPRTHFAFPHEAPSLHLGCLTPTARTLSQDTRRLRWRLSQSPREGLAQVGQGPREQGAGEPQA